MTGVTQKDVFQNMMTYGMFTGAWSSFMAPKKSAAWSSPPAPGNSNGSCC